MKQILTINVGGKVFEATEEVRIRLLQYLQEVKQNIADSDEALIWRKRLRIELLSFLMS